MCMRKEGPGAAYNLPPLPEGDSEGIYTNKEDILYKANTESVETERGYGIPDIHPNYYIRNEDEDRSEETVLNCVQGSFYTIGVESEVLGDKDKDVDNIDNIDIDKLQNIHSPHINPSVQLECCTPIVRPRSLSEGQCKNKREQYRRPSGTLYSLKIFPHIYITNSPELPRRDPPQQHALPEHNPPMKMNNDPSPFTSQGILARLPPDPQQMREILREYETWDFNGDLFQRILAEPFPSDYQLKKIMKGEENNRNYNRQGNIIPPTTITPSKKKSRHKKLRLKDIFDPELLLSTNKGT